MRVLLVGGLTRPSFVQNDVALLEQYHQVTELSWSGGLRPAVGVLLEIARSDGVLCWFMDTQALVASLLAKLLRRTCIVVVGGYDATALPEIGYGLFLRREGMPIAFFTCALATKVWTVHQSLADELTKRIHVAGRRLEVVPTGYDADKFRPAGTKEPIVLTVGSVDPITVRRKGIDTFVESARLLPDCQFTVVGRIDARARSFARGCPPNVRFTDWLSENDLRSTMARSWVYCQLSLFEGLPNALCEAMLSGCIPVATRHPWSEDLLREVGYLVQDRDPAATAGAVRKALGDGGWEEARRAVMRLYPLTARREALLRAFPPD